MQMISFPISQFGLLWNLLLLMVMTEDSLSSIAINDTYLSYTPHLKQVGIEHILNVIELFDTWLYCCTSLGIKFFLRRIVKKHLRHVSKFFYFHNSHNCFKTNKKRR